MQENKKILLINDLSGYGKVALSVMIPILSHMKYQVFNLPTALVSNTLDYGKFDILDTTDYMKNTIKVWDELNFSFDAICTGFITSAKQAELVYEYCKIQKEKGTIIVVDPIMGDNGVLYNGISKEVITYMKKLCAVADVIIPNISEACFMTGIKSNKSIYSRKDISEIVGNLERLGSNSIVITSVNLEGNLGTIIKEKDSSDWKCLGYTEIPVRFPGTGDIFTSIVSGNILKGKSLESAVKSAMFAIEYLIKENKDNIDKYKGIPIEIYLEEMQYEGAN